MLPFYSQAQLAPKYNARKTLPDTTIRWLETYSRNAYETETEDFIAYDMMLDGFIPMKKPFKIVFKNDTLTLDDFIFQEGFRNLYLSKINKYYEKNNVPKSYQVFTITSPGYGFEPGTSGQNIDCRYKPGEIKIEAYHLANSPSYEAYIKDSTLIHQLYADSLFTKPVKIYVRCNTSTCWINMAPIHPNLYKKYFDLVTNISGTTPQSENDFAAVTIKKQIVEYVLKQQ